MHRRSHRKADRLLQLEELEARFVLSSDALDAVAPVEQYSAAQFSIAQQAMGTYLEVAGAIPPATSSAWFDWYNTLKNARLDYSLQPRAQTFYFSATGNDTTGTGSQANPWQSLSKARSVLTQTGGDVALLFKRGDEFYDTVGLTVTQPFVTIGAWGNTNVAKPMISAFTIKYPANSNVWTQVAGTNSWRTSAPDLIGWIRDATNDVSRLSALTYLQTSTAVGSTARSWTWASGTLYLNPGAGVNPNTIKWEAVGDNNQDGIAMSGNGGLITDIRADGWGCVATQQYQSWGIKINPADNWSVVAMNTESYYNGRHGTSTHSYLPNSSGGFALLLNNVSGYTTGTVTQSTVFNIFSPNGGNEVLSEGNTVRFGRLPDFNLIGGGLDTQTPAFFGHTGNQVGQTVSLVISTNDRVIRENYAGATYSSGLNTFDIKALPGDNSDLSSLRRFVVNYQVQIGVPYTVSATPKSVLMNNIVEITGGSPTSGILDSTGGWFINCIWSVVDPVAIDRFFVNAYSATPTVYLLYNSFLLNGVSTASYQAWNILVNYANQNQSIFAANNVFARTNARDINLNIVNDAQHLLSNAYYQVSNTSTYAGDPFALTLSSLPNLLSSPAAGSPLIGGAKASTFGYTVDYDFYGHQRNLEAPTLGAIEFDWDLLPVTDAGQYYIVHSGQSLVLEARNQQAGASYSWEINGDSVYGDAVGANPTLTWSQLRALGMNDGAYSVRLRTTIGSTVTYSSPAYLEVINRAPYANAGTTQTVFGGESLHLDGSGSFSFTPNEALSYSWDVNGDGVFGDATGVNPTLTANQLINLGLHGGSTYGVRVKVWQSYDPTMVSTSTPMSLTYYSLPVDPGGPYFGDEGKPIILTAGSAGTGAIYQWDLDNDGQFDDATGQSVSYTPADNGVFTVKLQITLGNQIAAKATTITANNVAPTLTITGPTSISRKTETYTITTNDSPADLNQSIFYEFDWNGDGIYEESMTGPTRLSLKPSFVTPGTHTFFVRATDKDGAVGAATPFQYTMLNPYVISGNTLNWYMSGGDDTATFISDSATSFRVIESELNGNSVANVYQFSSPITSLIIFGQGGNDFIQASGMAGINVSINGGDGDDTIVGTGGNDLVDGGEGNDTINDLSGNNNIDGAEGNDTIQTGGGSDTIKGGVGDDIISAGAGNDYVDGAEGNDQIYGEAGDDLLIGGKDSDSINGDDGDDLIFGGAITNIEPLKTIWNSWVTHPIDRHTPIVAITKQVIPTDDGSSDFFTPGYGFDVAYNDVTRKVSLSQPMTGNGWIVTNSASLANAMANAQAGDLIYISTGEYTYTPTARKLPGVTILGDGIGKTIIHGAFIIDNQNDQRTTTISNLTLDHSGLPYVSYYLGAAYNTFAMGRFYFDSIEVKGPGTGAAPAVYFWSSSSYRTYAYMANSYVHDLNDDGISTWGPGVATDSIVELYDTTGRRAGPKYQDQLVTSHNALPIAIVGGYYADANANVIAPDGLTTIDMFFVTIAPESRNGGIRMQITWSIIDTCTISTTFMDVYGTVKNSTITQIKPYYPVFLNVLAGATVSGNTVINNTTPYYPGAYTRPARITGNNATVVDNVFVNWNNLELDINLGITGSVVSGNTYQ